MQVFNHEMRDSKFPFNKLNKMVVSQFNGHEKNSPSELGFRNFGERHQGKWFGCAKLSK